MHPLKEGIVDELPGNNISFKREILNRGRRFVRNGFWKTYWCRELQAEGIQLISNPSVLVRYRKKYRLGSFLIRRFTHGRCFAGMRIKKDLVFKRACYLIGTVILPLMFLWRIITDMINKKRHIKEFVISFPITVMAVVIWSLGEFWGYLTGPGNSCDKIFIS